MFRIFNLYRISLKNTLLLFLYYFKKALKLTPTEKEKQINDLYNHLIRVDGYLTLETPNEFFVEIKPLKCKLKIRKSPSSDLMVFFQVFRGQEYHEVISLFRKNFKTDAKYIIDAGGNVGYTSVLMNSIFKDAQLIIIEPSIENCNMINDNFKFNNITTNLYKGGLWNKNTYLKLIRDFRDQLDWAIRVEESDKQTDLKAFTVNHILKESKFEQIDIFKMDIEGAEKQVLDKESDLSFLDIVKCISVEIHDEFECREDIYEVLTQKGFELTNIGELTIGINTNLK